MHEKNIDLLCEEAQRLLTTEIEFLKRMQDEAGVIAEAQAGENQSFDRDSILKHGEVLKGELTKLKDLEMVLAVVGTMKAGKSTTINAIVGTEVLPNRNRPMTALPTLIRHTPGQIDPVLKFENNAPINDLMLALHKVLKSAKAKDYVEDVKRNPDMEELIALIDQKATFKQAYRGADSIFWFLKSLNDLVRLCGDLQVEFPFTSYDEIHEMPVIEVEFAHLREMKATNGRLTLLDTPGPNEAGQQHLRKMLKEQLTKASAVLAVLDFTQLKSDADAEVRRELEEIASVAEGRLFALVNKFDQKDRHGDNEEQVKAFVSESLMEGRIEKSHVFPVSSKWGYLANRAKSELFLHNKLPDEKEQPWVVDFAEEALGRRWESKIGDAAEVKHAAEELWKDSLFTEPMEKVIHAAHAGAAAYAIDSAAAKLIDIADRANRFLGLRETALSKSAKELQQQIAALQKDMDKIATTEKATVKKVNEMLAGVTKGTGTLFSQIEKNVLEALEVYFKEGKMQERLQAEEKKQKKKDEAESRWGGGLFGSLHRSASSSNSQVDFDPKSSIIKFDGRKEARALLKKIKDSVDKELSFAEDAMRTATGGLLQDFRGHFRDDVLKSVQEILGNLESRMQSDGFSIEISIPDMRLLSLSLSTSDVLDSALKEKSKKVSSRRRKDGMWGSVCSFFGTNDWGWEDYEETERYFEVDIRKVQKSVIAGIKSTFDGLEQAVASQIETPLRNEVGEFFDSFKSKVELIRGDLLQSIRDQERSKAEKDALSKRLASLKKNIPLMLNDSRELKADVEPMLPMAEAVLA